MTLELHQLPEHEVRRGWVRIHESERRGIKYGELIEIKSDSGRVLRVVYGFAPGWQLGALAPATNWLCMDEPTRQDLSFSESSVGSKVTVEVRQFERSSRWAKWLCYSLRHPEIPLEVATWLALVLGGLSVGLGIWSVILGIISLRRVGL